MPERINPFLYSRREYEEDSIIFVTGGREGFLDWVTGQQQLFEGLRGSGKSSILRSMEWDVAWGVCNTKVAGPQAVMQIFSRSPKHYPPKHFGVRCRLEEMDREYWGSWKEKVGLECSQKYFGTYLEHLLMDLFLNALLRIMQEAPELFTSAECEKHLIQDLLQTGFPDPYRRPRLPEQSLWALKRLIRDQHLAIRDLVYRKTPKEEMYESHPILSPGSLIQCFGKSLTTNYDSFSDLKIFPMLDDCNHLTDWQLQVVNSAISKARTPISYKVTSVFGLYKTRKTMDDRPVNEQELKTVRISGSNEAKWEHSNKFEKLVQGVCQTRIERYYGKEFAEQFGFKRLLGDFDLQHLLEKRLSESEKPSAIGLLQLAKKEAEDKAKNISITSTWLCKVRVREQDQPSHKDPKIQERLLRRLYSMYTKKWSYAAAVAVCQDIKLTFPYCGWSTVLHLCSGSIREILSIMSEIWNVLDLPIERFVVKESVDYHKQMRAIKNASKNLFEGIDKKPLFKINNEIGKHNKKKRGRYPYASLPSICTRLGKLFAHFQSYPALCATAESGALKVYRDELDEEVIAAIDFAVMTGVILKIEDESIITIGLHPMLSPLFNISFRSPFYYPESVSGEAVAMLFKGNDTEAEKARDKIVNDRMRRYFNYKDQQKIQMKLFDKKNTE